MKIEGIDEFISEMFDAVGAVRSAALAPLSRALKRAATSATIRLTSFAAAATVGLLLATAAAPGLATAELGGLEQTPTLRTATPSEEARAWLGLDSEAGARAWMGALSFLETHGRDVPALLTSAARNLTDHHGKGLEEPLPLVVYGEDANVTKHG